MKIEIYSIPNCPYCVKAKNLAEREGHEVDYKMIGEDFLRLTLGNYSQELEHFHRY